MERLQFLGLGGWGAGLREIAVVGSQVHVLRSIELLSASSACYRLIGQGCIVLVAGQGQGHRLHDRLES